MSINNPMSLSFADLLAWEQWASHHAADLPKLQADVAAIPAAATPGDKLRAASPLLLDLAPLADDCPLFKAKALTGAVLTLEQYNTQQKSLQAALPAVNWANIAAFITNALPKILEIITLFAK